MADVLEPVLISVVSQVTLVANTGQAISIDLDLALNEGALIEVVELGTNGPGSAANQLTMGISHDPDEAVPTSQADIRNENDVFAIADFADAFTTSGKGQFTGPARIDLSTLNFIVTRDLTFLGFSLNVNVAAYARVYWRRVRLSDVELVRLVATRR